MPLMEPGTHDSVEIIGSVLQPGKSDDDPVICLTFFEVLTEETINAYLYTTEKAWPYTRKKLEACGFDINAHDGDLSVLNGDNSPILHNKTRIVVEEKEYQGDMKRKVVTIGDDVNFTERMEPAQASTFAAKLRARLVAGGEVKASSTRTTRKAAPRSAPTANAASSSHQEDPPF